MKLNKLGWFGRTLLVLLIVVTVLIPILACDDGSGRPPEPEDVCRARVEVDGFTVLILFEEGTSTECITNCNIADFRDALQKYKVIKKDRELSYDAYAGVFNVTEGDVVRGTVKIEGSTITIGVSDKTTKYIIRPGPSFYPWEPEEE